MVESSNGERPAEDKRGDLKAENETSRCRRAVEIDNIIPPRSRAYYSSPSSYAPLCSSHYSSQASFFCCIFGLCIA